MRQKIVLVMLFYSLQCALLAQTPFRMGRYVNHTEAGILVGRVKYAPQGTIQKIVEPRNTFTVQTFNGVALTPGLDAGITIGADFYKTAWIMPVAAGVRYRLAEGPNAGFFVSADVGRSVGWIHQDSDGYKTKGGWVVNPGIGLRLGRRDKAGFTLTAGYKRQEAYTEKPLQSNTLSRSEDRVYNRLVFRLGIAF